PLLSSPNDPSTPSPPPPSLHDALPIFPMMARGRTIGALTFLSTREGLHYSQVDLDFAHHLARRFALAADNARLYQEAEEARERLDRKSTRLNSSHRTISYAVFCLKKKK